MKTDKVLLSQLKVNENNPRTITERKINLLVERLLAFPKMIEIRPVVVDESFTALGGNMRLRAFERISKMSIEDIADVLGATKNYQALTEAEKENIMNQWQEWLDNPTVDVVKASTLSESEKKEFIIADNASFGEWDYDKLANEWDSEDLTSWGVDVWMPDSGESVNIDELFEPCESTTSQPESFKIEVRCPNGLVEQREDIVSAIRNSLQAYRGIEIV